MRWNEAAALLAALVISSCEPTGEYDSELSLDVVGLDLMGEVPYQRGGRIDVVIYACVDDLPSARAELRNAYVVGDGGVSTTTVTLVAERPFDGGITTADAGAPGARAPMCAATRLIGRAPLVVSPGRVRLEVDALGQREELEFIVGAVPAITVSVIATPASPIGMAEIVDLAISAPTATGTPFTVTTLPPVPTSIGDGTISAGGTGMAAIAIPDDVTRVRVSVSVGGVSAEPEEIYRTMAP